MVRILRYLADKLEALQYYLISKWNGLLKKLML